MPTAVGLSELYVCVCVIANKPDRVNKKLTASVSLLSRQNSVISEPSEPSLDSPLRVVVQARTIWLTSWDMD